MFCHISLAYFYKIKSLSSSRIVDHLHNEFSFRKLDQSTKRINLLLDVGLQVTDETNIKLYLFKWRIFEVTKVCWFAGSYE